jgi:hypothetical protein
MVTLKLSRWIEKESDSVWFGLLVNRAKQDGKNIIIIEDVPYPTGDSRGRRKKILLHVGVLNIRFKTIGPRETPEAIRGNHKTFREYFAGKHPECDVRILGIAGEQSWMAIARMTQCMADYMDYIAERVAG